MQWLTSSKQLKRCSRVRASLFTSHVHCVAQNGRTEARFTRMCCDNVGCSRCSLWVLCIFSQLARGDAAEIENAAERNGCNKTCWTLCQHIFVGLFRILFALANRSEFAIQHAYCNRSVIHVTCFMATPSQVLFLFVGGTLILAVVWFHEFKLSPSSGQMVLPFIITDRKLGRAWDGVEMAQMSFYLSSISYRNLRSKAPWAQRGQPEYGEYTGCAD